MYETEHLSACATVLMVDISHSMILYGEDRITPAKKIALALTQLIKTRYPKDTLDVVLFGDDAVQVPLRDLMKIQAGPYHTNTRAGLQLAQRILERAQGRQQADLHDHRRQAVGDPGVRAALQEPLRPRPEDREQDARGGGRTAGGSASRSPPSCSPTDAPLLDFVRKLTALNHGRIYETDPQQPRRVRVPGLRAQPEEAVALMQYREHSPGEALAPFIECIWFLSGRSESGAEPERVLPDGCIELIVHLGDRFHEWTAAGEIEQPRAFVVGNMTRPLLLRAGARIATMGIRFRPGGAYPFLSVGLDRLTDSRVSLDALWGRDGAVFERQLLDARDDWERRAIVESFLLERLARGRLVAPSVTRAVSDMLESRGLVRVRELGRRVGWSERQLERRFQSEVGMSPKTLARIVRFQRVLQALGPARTPEWALLALECGYADQSHLIREVRDFAGSTPVALASSPGRLTAYFASQERLVAYFGTPD